MDMAMWHKTVMLLGLIQIQSAFAGCPPGTSFEWSSTWQWPRSEKCGEVGCSCDWSGPDHWCHGHTDCQAKCTETVGCQSFMLVGSDVCGDFNSSTKSQDCMKLCKGSAVHSEQRCTLPSHGGWCDKVFSAPCTPCAINTFSPSDSGDETCQSCPTGTHAPIGAASCDWDSGMLVMFVALVLLAVVALAFGGWKLYQWKQSQQLSTQYAQLSNESHLERHGSNEDELGVESIAIPHTRLTICSGCGSQLTVEANFCSNCGKPTT